MDHSRNLSLTRPLALERAQTEAAAQNHSRQSPSPTHKNTQGYHVAPHLRHQRRDSDTLRSGLPVAQPVRRADSLENADYDEPQRPQRSSPPGRSKSLGPSSRRQSPTVREIATAASATLVDQDEQHDSDNPKSEKAGGSKSQSQLAQQQLLQSGELKTRNLTVRIDFR